MQIFSNCNKMTTKHTHINTYLKPITLASTLRKDYNDCDCCYFSISLGEQQQETTRNFRATTHATCSQTCLRVCVCATCLSRKLAAVSMLLTGCCVALSCVAANVAAGQTFVDCGRYVNDRLVSLLPLLLLLLLCLMWCGMFSNEVSPTYLCMQIRLYAECSNNKR